MKFKIPLSSLTKLSENPDQPVKVRDPWWLIVLKVLAYLIGLIIAGYSTAEAANYLIY